MSNELIKKKSTFCVDMIGKIYMQQKSVIPKYDN